MARDRHEVIVLRESRAGRVNVTNDTTGLQHQMRDSDGGLDMLEVCCRRSYGATERNRQASLSLPPNLQPAR